MTTATKITDKKSLFALGCHRHTHHFASRIHAGLHQRVLCLEAALCFHIDNLCSRVCPARSCDSAMRVVFGAGEATQKVSALSSLEAYLSNLETAVGENWLWRPEKS